MLGDSIVIGREKFIIDDKGRFFLPTTMRLDIKQGDKLVFSIDDTKISLFSYEYINNLYKKLDLIKDKELLNQICSSIVGYSSVDKQYRIQIPKIIREEYNFEKEIYILGTGNSISISPTEEIFKNLSVVPIKKLALKM